MKRMRVGDVVTCGRLGVCRIIRIYRLGTVDVEARDGRCYRVSGLPL